MSAGTASTASCTRSDLKSGKTVLRWVGSVDRPWDVMYGCLLSDHEHYFTIRRPLSRFILSKRFRVNALVAHPDLPGEATFLSLIECMHWAEVYWRSYKGKPKEYEIGHPLTWGDI